MQSPRRRHQQSAPSAGQAQMGQKFDGLVFGFKLHVLVVE